ncbi:MIT protein [Trinorchestia longiramus]|nr:MIT protein [Trinorchestia longiramus]
MASSNTFSKSSALTIGDGRNNVSKESSNPSPKRCICRQSDCKICLNVRSSSGRTEHYSTSRPQHCYVYQNPVHESPEQSFCSDSTPSVNKSMSSFSQSANSESTSEALASHSSEVSQNSKASLAGRPKLTMPVRNQYQKLESTSITDATSQTYSSSVAKHEWKLLHSSHSTFESISAGQTLMDQSFSQLSSTMSGTLTPTPLQALPHSSTDLSSSSTQLASPLSPTPPIICSPPLSPITPLTNSITPENKALKKAKSKKSVEKATGPSQYIFMAAHQISEAQEHEKRNELAEAVLKYREGVGTLLQGVQGEDEANVARREGVRRKTAQYLQRAEQLLSRLTKQAGNLTGVLTSQPLMPDKECMSGVGICGLQCGTEVLRQYRVLGMSETPSCCTSSLLHRGVIIAQLPQSKHTVAIKVIVKSSNGKQGKSLIPRGIPHMVPVICYHETDSAVYLVMKYITGGRLWDHISKYVSQDCHASSSSSSSSSKPMRDTEGQSSDAVDVNSKEKANVYSGRRLLVDNNSLVSKPSNLKDENKEAKTKRAYLKKNEKQRPSTVDQKKTMGLQLNVKEEVLLQNTVQAKTARTSDDKIQAENAVCAESVLDAKQKAKLSFDESAMHRKLSPTTPLPRKMMSLDVEQKHSMKESQESPSVGDPKASFDVVSQVEDSHMDMTVEESMTSMLVSSRFTSESDVVVARSGMARYQHLDTSSCASNTSTIAPDWGDSDAFGVSLGTSSRKEDSTRILSGPKSEVPDATRGLDVMSERHIKTSPIACRGQSEINLCENLEFFPSHFVSKSVSAEDLSLHSISTLENVNVQHSTISTVNVAPLVPKIYCKADSKNSNLANEELVGKDDEENVSIGSDTLSGVSDDFSCSISINHQSEDRKKSAAAAAATSISGVLSSDTTNLLSECAISEGRKRPCNTPDSAYAFMQRSERALMSLCQSTSADITSMDMTLEPSAATLNNSIFSATLNASEDRTAAASATTITPDNGLKKIHVEKLISIADEMETKSLMKSASPVSSCSLKDHVVTETSSLSLKLGKKLLKSNSDDLSLEKDDKKADDERCPSEPASVSSVTLPSFSTSQVGDPSGSEVASFDIEELIRNSRRLLQNVDVTLEQSKGKGVKPVASEDSSTSIDQSELPLDSVSVGFDTPDMPSNSTRCSNVSSDHQHQSKQMADNTYSSIPSIALDTSRHAIPTETLNVGVDLSASSMDKAVRSPRHVATVTVKALKELSDMSITDGYLSCKDSDTSKESDVIVDKKAFLALPKESVTSKEDSTNPSDIHTQIHLSATGENEPKEEDAKLKGAVLARQANFEKSDTSHSSVPRAVKRNALEEIMKAYGGDKVNGVSSPVSNDSTSISGLTLNNSESQERKSKEDSSHLSVSENGLASLSSVSKSNGEAISSESTSGLKYCPNPVQDLVSEACQNQVTGAQVQVSLARHDHIPRAHQDPAVGVVNGNLSALLCSNATSRGTSTSDQALSEPLYLLPQRERAEIMAQKDLAGQEKSNEPKLVSSVGRRKVAATALSPSNGMNSSNRKIITDQLENKPGILGKTDVVSTAASPADDLVLATSMTESFSLHTCKSKLSVSETSEPLVCDSETTISNNYIGGLSNGTNKTTNTTCKDSSEFGDNTDLGSSSIYSASTSFVHYPVEEMLSPRCRVPAVTEHESATNLQDKRKKPASSMHLPHQQSSLTIVSEFNERESPKKFSIIHQTPLSGLLEKYWLSAREKQGDASNNGHDKRHLPEGLVKVWGAQLVTAIAALHDMGIVWGDFGPRNVLLEEGGSVLVTLETRWATVDIGRPAAGHCSMRCHQEQSSRNTSCYFCNKKCKVVSDAPVLVKTGEVSCSEKHERICHKKVQDSKSVSESKLLTPSTNNSGHLVNKGSHDEIKQDSKLNPEAKILSLTDATVDELSCQHGKRKSSPAKTHAKNALAKTEGINGSVTNSKNLVCIQTTGNVQARTSVKETVRLSQNTPNSRVNTAEYRESNQDLCKNQTIPSKTDEANTVKQARQLSSSNVELQFNDNLASPNPTSPHHRHASPTPKNTSSSSDWSSCCHVLCHVCLGYVAPELQSPLASPTPASDWWSVVYSPVTYSCLHVASQQPCLTTALPHNSPASQQPCLITALPHYSPASLQPCLITALPHNSPAS